MWTFPFLRAPRLGFPPRPIATPATAPCVWFHGDVASGNLVVDGAGRLAPAIDFGTCGVGDRACDLAAAWRRSIAI